MQSSRDPSVPSADTSLYLPNSLENREARENKKRFAVADFLIANEIGSWLDTADISSLSRTCVGMHTLFEPTLQKRKTITSLFIDLIPKTRRYDSHCSSEVKSLSHIMSTVLKPRLINLFADQDIINNISLLIGCIILCLACEDRKYYSHRPAEKRLYPFKTYGELGKEFCPHWNLPLPSDLTDEQQTIAFMTNVGRAAISDQRYLNREILQRKIQFIPSYSYDDNGDDVGPQQLLPELAKDASKVELLLKIARDIQNKQKAELACKTITQQAQDTVLSLTHTCKEYQAHLDRERCKHLAKVLIAELQSTNDSSTDLHLKNEMIVILKNKLSANMANEKLDHLIEHLAICFLQRKIDFRPNGIEFAYMSMIGKLKQLYLRTNSSHAAALELKAEKMTGLTNILTDDNVDISNARRITRFEHAFKRCETDLATRRDSAFSFFWKKIDALLKCFGKGKSKMGVTGAETVEVIHQHLSKP